MTEIGDSSSDPMLLRPDEAARMLAISPRTLWGLTAAGELAFVSIGHSVRYDISDLREWVASRKTRKP